MSAATSPATSPGDFAHSYAARGWLVFPVERGGKRPCGRLAPHGLHDATTDTDQVAAWWGAEPEANIGLSCGASGLVALDLDVPHDLDVLTALFQEYDLRPTFWSTTPRGGSHLLYRVPDGRKAGPNSAGKLSPRVDVRGAGGYVVLPPSIGAAGLYRWRWYSARAEAEWAPEILLEPLEPPSTPRASSIPAARRVPGERATHYGWTAARGELRDLEAAPEGERNATLNIAAFKLSTLVAAGHLEEGPIKASLRHVALGIGLSAREVEATIASAFAAGLRQPRAVEP